MSMTLSFVRAEVQRAQARGAKTVEINILDMIEILPKAEAQIYQERSERKMRPAGWASPVAMQMMTGRKLKRSILKRRKTSENNLELFFCDDLKEKIDESRLLIAAEKAELEAKPQEAAHVPCSVS